jgi:hypothetical protein
MTHTIPLACSVSAVYPPDHPCLSVDEHSFSQIDINVHLY